jgi:antagonist of KipI
MFGIPVSGAMDQFSLIAANCLVGNDQNSACLETTLIGPELQALTQVQVAVTGGTCSPTVNGNSVPMWQTLSVEEGDVVACGRMETGCRAYMAVRGGIEVPLVLGSASTYVRGQLGGIEGRHLKAEDEIGVYDAEALDDELLLPLEMQTRYLNDVEVGVITGPQDDMFTKEGIETLLTSRFKVTLEADRMGYRLEGPLIKHVKNTEIVSDAILPGAIQVPKSGRPILMMCDAQTTGGYPKIATVISSDLSKLGQAKPNDTIKFTKTTLREAQEKTRAYSEMTRKMESHLVRI